MSVVTPCYNEEASLRELYARVSKVCSDVVGTDWEFILVNDGSRDGTWRTMIELTCGDPNVVAANLARNYGHQVALSAGLQLARGERVLILDADLQDPPELLRPMMVQMDAGTDVVYGQRTDRVGETPFKRVTASVFYRLFRRLVDIDIPLDAGDFRLISRRALDVLNAMPEQQRFIRGMVSWIGYRQEPILYSRAPRFAGKTNYPLPKMLRLALDGVTSFSVKPLRIASWLGVLAGLSCFCLIAYALISWASGRTVEGWTSIMIIVLITASCQLLVLGVIGEYLGRLYMECKRRPLYVVEQVRRQ